MTNCAFQTCKNVFFSVLFQDFKFLPLNIKNMYRPACLLTSFCKKCLVIHIVFHFCKNVEVDGPAFSLKSKLNFFYYMILPLNIKKVYRPACLLTGFCKKCFVIYIVFHFCKNIEGNAPASSLKSKLTFFPSTPTLWNYPPDRKLPQHQTITNSCHVMSYMRLNRWDGGGSERG